MLKTIIPFIICFLLPAFSFAQAGDKADSLRLRLNHAKTDTGKAQALTDLGLYYQETNRDTALLYSNELINLGEKMNNALVKVTGLTVKAYVFYHKGDLLGSYKLVNSGFEIARDKASKKVNWVPMIFGTRRNPEEYVMFVEDIFTMYMAFIYAASGNIDRAISYYKKSIETTTDKTILLGVNMNLGSSFNSKKEPDSALVYSARAMQYSIEIGETTFRAAVTADFGDAYFLKGQLDSAQRYYRSALFLSRGVGFRLVEIMSLLGLAEYYNKKNQADSMLFYAQEALKVSDEFRQFSTKGQATELIAQALKKEGKLDSAYSYLSIAKNISDSLSVDKNKKSTGFQSFDFEEQFRLEKTAQENTAYRNRIKSIAMITGIALVSLLAWVFYRNNRRKQKDNKILESTLTNLKATQVQLIQSEKMASLGELTAGIAHEIQNPLNFVNNFSEVNEELLAEMKDEIGKGNHEEAMEIADDAIDNQQKILFHGKRADAIVKGMLQHSRSSSGKKEPTDINDLADEYLRLAYYGLRAKDKSFNATLKTDFDETIGAVNLISQEIGRVILNLITNAFYAVDEKKSLRRAEGDTDYEPTVSLSTKRNGDTIEITVADNGNGIPQNVIDKIFQPFFTTKPTGQGTGLGLSMSYDIVQAHGGELKVNTGEGKGSRFIILLPVK